MSLIKKQTNWYAIVLMPLQVRAKQYSCESVEYCFIRYKQFRYNLDQSWILGAIHICVDC